MSETIKLTDKTVLALKPSDKNYDVWDSDIKGFTIRVHRTNIKTFRFVYRFAGARKAFTIGKFGTLITAQARNVAKLWF